MTAFYCPELLAQTSTEKDRYGRFIGCFDLDNVDDLVKCHATKNKSFRESYGNPNTDYGITGYKYYFSMNQHNSLCTIQLQGTTKCGYLLNLARVTISTVDSNCGTIIISNLCSDFIGAGFGTLLLQQTLKYLQRAGYSFLLLNTAGKWQNDLGKKLFQEKFGFYPMKNNVYINKRSGNVNLWYFKYLPDVREVMYSDCFIEDVEEDEDDF